MAVRVDQTSDRESVMDTIKGSRDAISVKRVFGDAYEVDGLTVVPVARASGGGGGGWGEGGDPSDENGAGGSGSGSGYGVRVSPVGVYEIRNGELAWKPAIDVTRLARGGQVLVGIALVGLAIVLSRRR